MGILLSADVSVERTTVCPTAGSQDSIINIINSTNNSYTYAILSGNPAVELCTIDGGDIVIRTSSSSINERGSILVTTVDDGTTYQIDYGE